MFDWLAASPRPRPVRRAPPQAAADAAEDCQGVRYLPNLETELPARGNAPLAHGNAVSSCAEPLVKRSRADRVVEFGMQCDDAGCVSRRAETPCRKPAVVKPHAHRTERIDEVGLVHRDIDGSHGHAPMCIGQEGPVPPCGALPRCAPG